MYCKLNLTMRNLGTNELLDLYFNISPNKFSQKWAEKLHVDFLDNDVSWIQKDFLNHSWDYNLTPNSKTKEWLCKELNWHIEYLDNIFASMDGFYYTINMHFDHNTVDQPQLNEIHRHFELLSLDVENKDLNTTWMKQYLPDQKRDAIFNSIWQLNLLCHQIEGRLIPVDKSDKYESWGEKFYPRSGLVVCIRPEAKCLLDIHDGDYDEFKMEDREFGDVVLHYPQTGKPILQTYTSNDTNIPMDQLSPNKFLSGEFDVAFNTYPHVDWEDYKQWCTTNNVDINDKSNALGHCVLAKMDKTNFGDKAVVDIHDEIQPYSDLYTITLLNEDSDTIASKTYEQSWIDQYQESFQKKYGFSRNLFE